MIEFVKNRKFAIEDYEPFIGKAGRDNRGIRPLPNAEPIDADSMLLDIAARGHCMQPFWGYTLLPDGSRPQWTQLFLTTYMMSGLDGGGYAITYSSDKPILRRFAICRHEKAGTGTREQENRGWHPGSCSKCGYNMTYDSGD